MPISSIKEEPKENSEIKPKPKPKTLISPDKTKQVKTTKIDESEGLCTKRKNKTKARNKKVADPVLNIEELKDKLKDILNKENNIDREELKKLLNLYEKSEGELIRKNHKKKSKSTKNIKQEELHIKEEISELEVEDTRTFPCPICKDKEPLRTFTHLKEHYREKHKGKRLRASKYCLKTYPCDVCGKEFKTNSSLRDHVETHYLYYHCDHCDKSHKKLLLHILHVRVHAKDELFKCIACDLATEDITKITDHVNDEHAENVESYKYWCQPCKKGFHLKSWFEEHENFHKDLKPFACVDCGKKFMYLRHLKAHKTLMHKVKIVTGPRMNTCVICKKEYQHRNSLKLHMNSHTGNFAICDICGKVLSSKEKLKFHIRTHTGYKPFKCTHCEKSFTKKPILQEHVRIHTGERPYKCEHCNKTFSQRSSLVIHVRGHTGERPYPCELCKKGFMAKSMLNLHLKSCKGVNFYSYE